MEAKPRSMLEASLPQPPWPEVSRSHPLAETATMHRRESKLCFHAVFGGNWGATVAGDLLRYVPVVPRDTGPQDITL